jgi:1-acyl-sn-glycerol-3-phosphate acyltransferase
MQLGRSVRATWRLLRGVLHMLHGLALVLLVFPWLADSARQLRIAWWSSKMLRLLGIALQLQGTFRPGATLVVANHISWLDILAVHAVCPRARFVSKADVRAWPLLGRLIDAAGTLYLERERKRDALRVVHQIADALRAGELVAVFPEGTTSDGKCLLPFHANLLQAAIATGTPVQPVALTYLDAAVARSPAVAWVGDDSLAQSLWRITCAQGLRVQIDVIEAQASLHADRRALAQHLHRLIGEQLDRVAACA